jgi:predicted phage-related endonuclease
MKAIPKQTHGSLAWKQQRWKDENGRCLFGASDAPALMNASPYRSRADLFVDKTTEPQDEQIVNDIFYRGNLLEPALVQHAKEMLQTNIVTPEYIYRDGRWSISMDGVDNPDAPEVGIECKTTTRYHIETSEDLPMEWRWQGWAQMLVLNVPIFFSVLDAGQRVRFVELQKNNEALDLLQEQAEVFGNAVDTNDFIIEIDELTAEQIARILPVKDEEVELGSNALVWIASLEDARAMKKQAEAIEKDAKDHLARMLQSATRGTINGIPMISWKQQRSAPSVDVKALKEEHPELVAQYMKEAQSFRVMRITNKAEK